MKGGPVLHLEHTRRGVWVGPPPPNWSVLARLEADILIGQREKVTVKAQLIALLHVSLNPSCLVATLR